MKMSIYKSVFAVTLFSTIISIGCSKAQLPISSTTSQISKVPNPPRPPETPIQPIALLPQSPVKLNKEYDFSKDNLGPSRTLSKDLGFANLGNTCFANAALKLLSNHTPVTDLVNSTRNTLSVRAGHQPANIFRRYEMQRSLADIYAQLSSNRSSPTAATNYFANELEEFFACFNYYLTYANNPGQVDFTLDERFTTCKERIKEYTRTQYPTAYRRGKLPPDAYVFEDFAVGRRYFMTRDSLDSQEFLNQILDLLDYPRLIGKPALESIFRLESGHQWVTTLTESGAADTISMLQFEVQDETGAKVDSVAKAANNFFLPETLNDPRNYITNPITGMGEPGTKQLALIVDPAHIPQQMIIQLKRYGFDRNTYLPSALKHSVKISDEIELHYYQKGFESRDIGVVPPNSIRMKPMGVVVHHGDSPNGGHYFAYIYNQAIKSWELHNDEHVKVLAHSELRSAFNDMAKNGYLLLYGVR
jgi:ubiquitin C-terminal hydrolase